MNERPSVHPPVTVRHATPGERVLVDDVRGRRVMWRVPTGWLSAVMGADVLEMLTTMEGRSIDQVLTATVDAVTARCDAGYGPVEAVHVVTRDSGALGVVLVGARP